MDLELAARLRRIVEPPNPQRGERPWSISILDDGQLCEIYSLHMRGEKNRFIRSYIQERFGLLRDKKPFIIEKTLSKLWERAIGPQDNVIRLAQITDTKDDDISDRVRAKIRKLDREIIKAYDPLRKRLDLLEDIDHTIGVLKVHVIEEGTKIEELRKFYGLQMQCLKETEELLERMRILGPRQDSPAVQFNTQIIQGELSEGRGDKFAKFLGKLQGNLAQLAIPEQKAMEDNGPIEDQIGDGATIDVEALPVGTDPTEPS